MTIYKSLKEYIETEKVSQRSLASELEISVSYLSMLVNGERRPSPELALAIETKTGIPFKTLLFGERDEVNHSAA